MQITREHSNTGFDTLAWSKMLKSGGMTVKQAESTATVIAQAVGQGAASKSDLMETENRLRTELQEVESRLEKRISAVREEMQSQKVDLIKWMVGLFLGQIALIIGLIQYLDTVVKL